MVATERKTKEERREEILDAALRVFADAGYDGASTFRTSGPRSAELKGFADPVELVAIEWR